MVIITGRAERNQTNRAEPGRGEPGRCNTRNNDDKQKT